MQFLKDGVQTVIYPVAAILKNECPCVAFFCIDASRSSQQQCHVGTLPPFLPIIRMS